MLLFLFVLNLYTNFQRNFEEGTVLTIFDRFSKIYFKRFFTTTYSKTYTKMHWIYNNNDNNSIILGFRKAGVKIKYKMSKTNNGKLSITDIATDTSHCFVGLSNIFLHFGILLRKHKGHIKKNDRFYNIYLADSRAQRPASVLG